MHLAFYFHSIENAGGAEKIIVNLLNFLSSKNINVELITFDKIKTKSFYKLNNEISWHKISSNNKISRYKNIYEILKSKKYNYFICFNLLDTKSIFFASLLARIPIIICERNGPSMYYIKYNLYQRFKIFLILFFSKKIIVQFKSYIKKYPWFLRKKITAIPNPINVKSNLNYTVNKKKFNILYLGRLDIFQKQINLIIDCFIKLHKKFPLWNLIIVGSGNDRDVLIKSVYENQITDRIKFIPETKDTEKYILESDLFIYPSRWEGFPNSLAEALAIGLPSIGMKNTEGVSNLIDSKNGWLADNTEDLVKIIAYAIENPNDRLIKSKEGKNILLNYNPDLINNKWYDYFKRLN